MTKDQAIKIITNSAKIFDEFFCKKNLLVIYGSPNSPNFLATKAKPQNFLHLTGVEINTKNILRDVSDKSSNPITVFYQKALANHLSIDDFSFKNEFTELKLSVLEHTLTICSNASMIGNYSNYRINLHTDKITGGQYSFLGLIESNGFYTPNTVMADDTRKNSQSTERVLAILSKPIFEKEYNKIEKVAKKIDINRLLQTLKEKISISPNLFAQDDAKKDIKEVNPTDEALNKEYTRKAEICDKVLAANPELKTMYDAAEKTYLEKKRLSIDIKNMQPDQRYKLYNEVLKSDDTLNNEFKKTLKSLKAQQLGQPTSCFSQNLDNFADRIHSENAAKSQQQSKPNLKPTDKPKR